MSAEETAAVNPSKKRKSKATRSGKGKKKAKVFPRMEGQGKAKKIDKKMKKLFRKRARDYNSDEDDDNGEENENQRLNSERPAEDESGEEDEDEAEAEEKEVESGSEGEGDEIETGVVKFVEGCRAFSLAFNKITKKSVSEDLLGPVLSGHKKLLAEKLAEEEVEHKVKADAKKEKNLLREKGHVKPANFLDSHEKFLVSVATKGVVKLFNGVNKAQNAQKGLNPSRTKDAKALARRRKAAFLSELHKKPTQDVESSKGANSAATKKEDGPAWAPLRDSYMLTSSKLKNWDKMQDTNAADDMVEKAQFSSSDED
ncbi:hypothetical protein Sjap_024265 [Stephania japonica]|uniref:RRP15-like protein n=1 Tax=Stephania japonica TaxID=461633 RepID=A0AAP0EKC8_9MAGN